jgi:predicted ArsR family transcriptional regulator
MSKHLKGRFNLHDLLNRQGEVQTHEVARRMGVPQRKAREDLKALAATGRVRQLRRPA